MGKVRGAVADAARDFSRGVKTFPASFRQAWRDPRSLTDGADVAPIAVLFGHTFMDAFDRGGFNVILPEIQDRFDLDLEGIAALASVAIVAGIVLSLPVSLWSDRSGRRTMFLGGGALLAAAFSGLSGVATTLGLFGVARAGFGFGLIVNDPVQQSLLSDFTPVRARPSVFAGRQIADNLGALCGPLVFGVMAWAFGWRSPLFFVLGLGIVVGVLSLRLREPKKGTMERAAMGVTGDDLDADEETAGFRESHRILKEIPTVRTLWHSLPFLLGGVLVMLVLIPLYLDEEFGVGPAERGIASALMGIPGIFGLFLGTALSKRFLFSEAPWRMFQLMSGIAIGVAVGIAAMAGMPNLGLVYASITILVVMMSLILPAYGTLFSIVMPARARTVGFAITRLWALPGLIVLPIAGSIGDTHDLRWGVLAGLPVFIVGAVILGTGGRSFQSDMAKAHEASMAAIAEQKAARRAEQAAAPD